MDYINLIGAFILIKFQDGSIWIILLGLMVWFVMLKPWAEQVEENQNRNDEAAKDIAYIRGSLSQIVDLLSDIKTNTNARKTINKTKS